MKGDRDMKDPLYERVRNELKLAVYFAREMMKELGKEKALEIIGKAYQNYSNDHMSEPYLDIPIEKRFPKFKENLKAEAARDKSFVIKEESARHIKVKFHRCPYYEVYRDFGIPEVCQKFCDGDFEAFRKLHPKLKVTREHEIAYGDTFCDHCWTLED
jgi:predicted ArsR family transcriptional regulator